MNFIEAIRNGDIFKIKDTDNIVNLVDFYVDNYGINIKVNDIVVTLNGDMLNLEYELITKE